MRGLRRITDGVLFQAVLTGSLSFSHIHDLAAAHGQAGWKAWLYPLSVDLLTVAAYRKLAAVRHTDTPVSIPPLAPGPVVPELANVAPAFLTWARRIADEHKQAHGSPIDVATLRARLKVAEPLALAVH